MLRVDDFEVAEDCVRVTVGVLLVLVELVDNEIGDVDVPVGMATDVVLLLELDQPVDHVVFIEVMLLR